MSLQAQCTYVFILDNGGAELWSALENTGFDRVEYLPMGGNVGIASALNVAAERAMSRATDFLALFDQDSSPSEDMIERLLESYSVAGGLEQHICAIGPRCVDYRQVPAAAVPSLRRVGLMPRRVECHEAMDTQQVDFLITSGSVVNLTALRKVGPFEDDLFVSYVDLEWGIRATSMGYKLLQCCSIEMPHEFGGGKYRRVLGRAVVPYKPIRYYYQARSWILLMRKQHIPIGWKLQLSRWLISQVVGILIVQNEDVLGSVKSLVRGIVDGIRTAATGRPVNGGDNK
jgi:rhamnosyltransferase